MRTTIRLDDDLYRQIKAKAARIGRPVGAVIEDAIRASLTAATTRTARPLPELPTFGSRGTMPGVDLTDNASVRELMDEGVTVDARR